MLSTCALANDHFLHVSYLSNLLYHTVLPALLTSTITVGFFLHLKMLQEPTSCHAPLVDLGVLSRSDNASLSLHFCKLFASCLGQFGEGSTASFDSQLSTKVQGKISSDRHR